MLLEYRWNSLGSTPANPSCTCCAGSLNILAHCRSGRQGEDESAVAQGRRDGGVGALPGSARVPEEDLEAELEAEPLYRAEVAVVARKMHPLAGATRLQDLQQARWAYATVARGPGAVLDEAFRAAGLEPPKPAIIFESLLALPDLVANTDLLATLPRALLGRGQAWDRLCVVPVTEKLPTLNLNVLRRASQGLTPAANELLGWIRQVARG